MLLIFSPHIVFDWISPPSTLYGAPIETVFITRGFFLIFGAFVGIYSYQCDTRMPLIFGSIAVIATSNLLMDFSIYHWKIFLEPSFRLAFVLLIRVIVVLLVISIFRNLDRIPEGPRALFKNPFHSTPR